MAKGSCYNWSGRALISMEVLGNKEVIKILERGWGGTRSWLGFPDNVMLWLIDHLKKVFKGKQLQKSYDMKVGKEVFAMKVQSNSSGEYIRISTFREGDEKNAYSICIPGGDNRSCWSILAEVLDLYMEKHGKKEVVQVIPGGIYFPLVLSSKSPRLRRMGMVKVSKRTSWNFIDRLIKQRLGIQRYLEME